MASDGFQLVAMVSRQAAQSLLRRLATPEHDAEKQRHALSPTGGSHTRAEVFRFHQKS